VKSNATSAYPVVVGAGDRHRFIPVFTYSLEHTGGYTPEEASVQQVLSKRFAEPFLR
jgi:hypothetical protein